MRGPSIPLTCPQTLQTYCQETTPSSDVGSVRASWLTGDQETPALARLYTEKSNLPQHSYDENGVLQMIR